MADVPCGVLVCALRRAEGRGGEMCHTAGDMRAERAEMGYTGIWREESGAEYGRGDMRAIARRKGEGADIKKNTLPRDIGILLFV